MTSTIIQLIVGLGNPGKEYESTRHNAGAWFVEALAKDSQLSLRQENKFQSLYAHLKKFNINCHLLVPLTFMNLSGQAVKACVNFYKLTPANLLVVHDDIDLPAGEVRLKYDGGEGGHNGLKNIVSHLHTKEFHRLRIGVGRPRKDVIDYVLQAPSKAEFKLIQDSMRRAEEVLPLLFEGKIQKAMQQLHTEKGKEE